MIKLVNKLTGGDMWVADNRVDKYLAVGHKLAAKLSEPEKPAEVKAAKDEKPAKVETVKKKKK